MKTVPLVLLLLLLAFLVGGCAMPKVEMPTDGEGSDEMRKSPCACIRLDYDGRGYRWLG